VAGLKEGAQGAGLLARGKDRTLHGERVAKCARARERRPALAVLPFKHLYDDTHGRLQKYVNGGAFCPRANETLVLGGA